MNRRIFTYPFGNRRDIGSKARNLIFLMKNGFSVPRFYLCPYGADGGEDALLTELRSLISDKVTYIVRSSADIEDRGDRSFAGQFLSVADLRGPERVAAAVGEVRASAAAPNVRSYLADSGMRDTEIRMGVIIQEMIPAVFSGIAFSKNPMTGLSEIIVEAGAGPGSLLMHEGREPQRWVSKWGAFIEKPENSAIGESLIAEVADKTAAIAKAFKKAADIEWIFDGAKLWFVQVRPITAIDIPVYSNRISREMLPGIIKPLVYSVNTQLINGIWVGLLRRLTGEKALKPEELTGHFYYRAYFNMSAFGRVFERLGMPYETIELMMGIEAEGPLKPKMKPGPRALAVLPGAAVFFIGLAGIGSRFGRLVKKKVALLAALSDEIAAETDPAGLYALKNKLSAAMTGVAYHNILIPLLAMAHTKMLASALKKEGVDFTGLDMTGITGMTREFSPHHSIALLHRKYFAEGGELSPSDRQNFEADMEKFLEKFGHFSDSGNDFSSTPWREMPETVENMIRNAPGEKNGAAKTRFADLKLKFPKNITLSRRHKKAASFASMRDEISSLYTYGYGLYRNIFLKIGSVLKDRGTIAETGDIFCLTCAELEKVLAGERAEGLKDTVAERRRGLAECADVSLPENIFGREAPPPDRSAGRSFRGTATSPGIFTGPVRVLGGLSEFGKLREGDILVIPYSDACWTPLFAKAGAVIAESGGMLSHSSIVAREYGIPAVVSVRDACRIPDGTVATVNGFLGKITLEGDLSWT